jgi:hypothetical protein
MSLPIIPVYEGCLPGKIAKITRKSDNPLSGKRKCKVCMYYPR